MRGSNHYANLAQNNGDNLLGVLNIDMMGYDGDDDDDFDIDVRQGDAFNADFHEAITQIPAPTEDLKGKIIDVIEKGYKLGEKIIRFPKVVIGQ